MSAAPKVTELRVHGKRLARLPRRVKDIPARPPAGFDGWFKPGVHGVLWLDADAKPFLYASRNGYGFLVSAREHDGRVRYMFAVSTLDRMKLGLPDDKDYDRLARDMLTQAGIATQYGATLRPVTAA